MVQESHERFVGDHEQLLLQPVPKAWNRHSMAQHGTAWHGWYVWDLCEADSLAYGAAGSSGRVISVALVMCCTSLRFGKRFLTVDFYTYSSYFFIFSSYSSFL